MQRSREQLRPGSRLPSKIATVVMCSLSQNGYGPDIILCEDAYRGSRKTQIYTHRCTQRTTPHTAHTHTHTHTHTCAHAHTHAHIYTHIHTHTHTHTYKYIQIHTYKDIHTNTYILLQILFVANRAHTSAIIGWDAHVRRVGVASQHLRPRCHFDFETFGIKTPNSQNQSGRLTGDRPRAQL